MAIDAAAWPPVTNDREHHAFFLAIISADDSAKPEIESAELAAWAAGFIWSPRVAGAAIDLRNRIWRQCCLRRSRETNGSADLLL